MRRRRLAVLGLGRVGRACARAIAASDDLALAGVVRRAERLIRPGSTGLEEAACVGDISELDAVEAALVCRPTALAAETMHDLIQHGIPAVDCAEFRGAALRSHAAALHRLALRHHVAAIVGAGWDPGALTVLRGLLTLLIPKGATEIHDRPGASLHHMAAAGAVDGVRAALCTELHPPAGRAQRYVYVELEPGADAERVSAAVRGDPLFLDTDTQVLVVDDVAALEDEGRGIVLWRRGTAARTAHQMLLLEGRFDLVAITAEAMLAAARALPALAAGAYTLPEVPLSALAAGQGEHGPEGMGEPSPAGRGRW